MSGVIEVQADGTGALSFRSDDAADLVVQADGFVTLSAAVVGELVRMAAQQPQRLPQPDARAILSGASSRVMAVVSATVPPTAAP